MSLPIVKLDRKSPVPLYRQIVDRLIGMIKAGALRPGDCLPSTRSFSLAHRINRSTVYQAYQELWSLGYTTSRSGSYTTIRQREALATRENIRRRGTIPWNRLAARRNPDMFRKPYGKPVRKLPSASPGTIDFRSLKHDQRLLPLDDARRSTVRGLARCLDDLPAVLDPSGYKPLREIVMKRLWLNGISADDGEILINAGHLQSLMLAIMLLTKPGDTVAMVAPTFWAIVPLLRHFQISIAGIPFTEDGPDLERTESLLSKSRPSFLYVMPNVHYPTCVTSGQDNRERLLRLCECFRVPLVEDGFEEDIKNTGKVLLPIKSMDKGKIVVYMGTFSRDLLGGMNAGWIAADRECVRRLAALKEVYDPGMPSLLQASIYQFFLRGRYEIHLRRLQKVYRRRLSVALRSLREHVSTSHATWHEPSGGYVVWLKLDGRLGPVDRVVERLASHRVLVYRGPPEYHSEPNRYVRLSFSALDEDAIDEGIRRLGKGLEAIDGGRRLVTGKSH